MKILFCSGMEESHQMFNEVTVAELKKDGEVEVVWVKSPRKLGDFLKQENVSDDIDILVSESDFRHIGLSDHGKEEEETVRSSIVRMINRKAPHIKVVFLRPYNSGHGQKLEARDRNRWSVSLSYRIREKLKN